MSPRTSKRGSTRVRAAVHTHCIQLTRFDNIPGLAQPSQLEDATVAAGGSSAPILVPDTIDGNPRKHEQNTTGNERRLERESVRHQPIAYNACYCGYYAVDESRATKDVGKRRLGKCEVIGR